MSQAKLPDRDIIIVDDDPGLLELLSMRLQASGYAVRTAASGQEAITLIASRIPALVISDLKMDGMDGMELLSEVQKRWPSLPVIILTAHGSIPDAVAATQKGAFAFLTKPVDKDALLSTLRKVSDGGSIIKPDESWSHRIVTRSPKMYQLLEQARLVAQSDVNVLINGESGTGKELLAEAIHCVSVRNNKPFIPVNCGAIPADLMESELFGHKKGAFTGAARDHTGLFAAADGGTLFLDEIGDMPSHLQVKLLRVLQERKIRPIGSTEQVPIDVRIVSATHRDLIAAAQQGAFREDLFYRLNVVNLVLPPLRERKEDIPLLVNHFLSSIADRTDRPRKHFADDAMDMLLSYDWPGNVRQLNNLIEQAVALSASTLISKEVIEHSVPGSGDVVEPLTEAKKAFEREYCERLLRITGGNIPEAARLAGRNRSDFYKIVKKHGIAIEDDSIQG